MTATTFGPGQPVEPAADDTSVTGQTRDSDGGDPSAALQAVLLGSPHAHARFTLGSLGAVRETPGVHLVLTAANMAHLDAAPCLGPMTNREDSAVLLPPSPLLADGVVRHVGDAVALVVADDAATARQARDAIVVAFEPLAAMIELEDAMAYEADLVWPQVPGNIAYDKAIGDEVATDAAFARAAHTVALTLVNDRLVATASEPQADIGRDEVLVVSADVGAGLGTEVLLHRDDPLLRVAAEWLGRPVRWVADRPAHVLGDAYGRDDLTMAEMALDASGKFLALRVDVLGNLGAYPALFGSSLPWLGAGMATGPYDIPTIHVRCRGVLTHTVPVDADRGAGRPEIAYVLERLVDCCALDLQMAPHDLRARNFVGPAQMPFKAPTEHNDGEAAMRQAMDLADVAGFSARAAAARARGRLRGLGLSSSISGAARGDNEASVLPRPVSGNVTHVCEVEIDPDTGVTTVERYTVCAGVGTAPNPKGLVEVVRAGVALGVRQALLDPTVDGQARGVDLPDIAFETRNIVSTTDPIGLQGSGEVGHIGACPALMNAVVNALQPYGIAHIDMPATPSRVLAAIAAQD